MAAANKLMAAFLMCTVVFAAVVVVNIEAARDVKETEANVKTCFNDCQKACLQGEGNGSTFCEIKCDSHCAKEELKAELGKIFNP